MSSNTQQQASRNDGRCGRSEQQGPGSRHAEMAAGAPGDEQLHPQRKPAPSAALLSRLRLTLASFSVRRSTAAASASKSAPLTG